MNERTLTILKTAALFGAVGAIFAVVLRKGAATNPGLGKLIEPNLIDREKMSPRLRKLLETAEATSDDVIGMPRRDAERLCRERGLVARVAEWGDARDKNYALTADLSIGRVNLRLRDGTVFDAYVV